MKQQIQALFSHQLATWEVVRHNYQALTHVKVRECVVNGTIYKVQFNPARLLSSAAKVDAQSLQERKCFLCPAHLPEVQHGIPFQEEYQILVNPFPIFPQHLTVPTLQHVEQRILHRFTDMLRLAAVVGEYVVFYNGPRCGASAPDHAHFQAGSKGFLPIEQTWEEQKAGKVIAYQSATLWQLNDAPRTTLVIEATEQEDAVALFRHVYKALKQQPGEEEPMMNLLAWTEAVATSTRWIVCLFPRAKHRPSCYTAQGEAHLLISPASVDMGGVLITPREEDFEKLKAEDIATLLGEVCLSPTEFQELIQRIQSQA